MAHGSATWGFPVPTCSPVAATTTAPSSTSSSNPWRKPYRSSLALRKRLRVDQRLRCDLTGIVPAKKGGAPIRRPPFFRFTSQSLIRYSCRATLPELFQECTAYGEDESRSHRKLHCRLQGWVH